MNMTREEAINVLKANYPDPCYSDLRKAVDRAIKALEEQQWILCSETIDLPDHEVLCCDRYGEELTGWLSYSDDQWLCESDGEMMYDPIAWREKPEPWRGDAE